MASRQIFDKALIELQQDILRMASLVEQAIYESVESLMKQDVTLAAQVIMGDETIDSLYWEIEAKIIKLIATQQPMAKDLRIVITGIKILVSLERMADHAVDIARSTMCLSGRPFKVEAVRNIPKMGELAQQMLKDGLDAYVHGDVEKAREMCAGDDEVDYIFDKVFRELMACMKKDPDMVVQGSYLLYVSRYLERIADHATNIGEAVVYLVTGERRELN
ncbi:phosphate signaling complex protein PhoU [Desulfolucanica intricata]|uniref:phosphate signaling complex protein PhoU n=1 Tax=Desulfolucanica intricata TaxID=1285191 RepID=UPI00082E3F06|nr:phosphate signaling complex protein PhoU [Desulfolucanica intricata]